MDKKSPKDFQQRPGWIFITLIIGLIGVAPNFSEQVLDFIPDWTIHKKWINLFFIVIGFILLYAVYWIEEQKHHDPDKISEDESDEIDTKKVKWFIWRQKIFKRYPLNIITLRVIPLFICWVISRFINKKYKSYLFNSFNFPRYWEKYAETPEEKEKYKYEKVTIKFFKSMFRVYIGGEINQSYEIKFERDFQHIEIRWTDKDINTFSEPRNDLYEKIFSEDKFKHIKIFTWIFPFGLYWNLRRVIKTLFQRKN